MSETVKLIVEGKEFEFPVITGTEGEKAIDISKLRDLTGHITLDIGFKNTGNEIKISGYLITRIKFTITIKNFFS